MKINIIKRSKISLIISLLIIIAGIVSAIIGGGLNLGIDFTGGSIVTVDLGKEFDVDEVRDVLTSLNAGEATILKSDKQAVIRLKPKPEEELKNINNQMIEKFKNEKGYKEASLAGVDRVGAVTSKELIINAFLSISIACILILLYVWARFEFYSGVCAVLALIHDVAIMVSFVSILRMPVNSSFIAGILTIVGYSINGTILVFDRFRENRKLYGKKMKDDDVINKSVSDTFWRSVNTSFTTFITVIALYILGVDSIKEFTLPIMIGLVAGAFSSIVLAGQWWYMLKRSFKKAQ